MSEGAIDAELEGDAPSSPLSTAEAEELLRRVAELIRSRADLPTGLRAAAEECCGPRLAQSFRSTADQLATGLPPEAVLNSRNLRLPSSVASLVAAAVRSGDCGRVLGELLDLKETLADVRREVRSVLAYPLLMLAGSMAVVVLLLNAVVPSFAGFYKEFELDVSTQTKGVIWLSASGQWLVLGWLAVFATLGLVARITFPWAVWCRLRNTLPVVGVIYQVTAAAEFARTLSLLVENGLPLHEALSLAAASSSDGELSFSGKRVSAAVAQGTSFSDALEQEAQTFPAIMVPYVRLGERTNRLPATLAAAAEALLERIRNRAALIRSLAPPLLFLEIAAIAVSLPIALFTPLIALIQGLSGGGVAMRGPGGGAAAGPPAIQSPQFMYLLLLIFPLLAIMWGRRLLFRAQRGTGRSALETAIYQIEWRLLVVVALGGLASLSLGPLLPLAVVSLVVLVLCWFRYRNSSRHSLLLSLAIGAEAGVPLAEVARSCAAEFTGRLQRRTFQLAQLLEQGHRLSTALNLSRLWLPMEVRFAITTAEASGRFASSLREALASESAVRVEHASLSGRLTYLVWILVVMQGVVAFLMLKIVPVWSKMFEEFDIDLPPLTVSLVNVTRRVVQFWPLVFLFLGASFCSLLMLDVYFFRLAAFMFPWLERLRMRKHGTVVLRGLAAFVREKQPIEVALQIAAALYPVRIVARRLENVCREVQNGAQWQDSLRRQHLLSSYDSALLAAAQRADNLAWALGEVAESQERRINLRTRWIVNLLFPLLIVAIGGVVFFIVVGLFLPLIELVQGLSGPR